MRALDNDALICDFAQYYHIYNYMALDIRTAAILACGLPAESRTVRRVTERNYTYTDFIITAIVDHLSALVWLNGSRKGQKPKMLLPELMHPHSEKEENQTKAFISPDAFEMARRRIIGEENNG